MAYEIEEDICREADIKTDDEGEGVGQEKSSIWDSPKFASKMTEICI